MLHEDYNLCYNVVGSNFIKQLRNKKPVTFKNVSTKQSGFQDRSNK